MTTTPPPIASMNTVREWAKERLQNGMEPPWSYYRLMQVVDAIDNIQAGLAVTTVVDGLQQEDGDVHRLETAEARGPEGTRVVLPM